jgi:hypothetical protein
MRKLVVVLCCLALFGVACGDDAEPAGSAAVENAPDNVTGALIDVEAEGLGEVTGFTLKDGDETYEILIAEDVDYGFDLEHLREHLRTGDPVAVALDVRDGKLYALSIDDV